MSILRSSPAAFSFARVFALASNTLTDLTRQKVFYFILVFALILIGSSIFMARFSFQQEFQILKDVSLGTMSILSSLLAILATARLLPQDIEDRTAYTILAKPVPRFEYLLGKLLGVLALLGLSLLIMSALFFAVLYAREQTVLHETARQMSALPHDQVETPCAPCEHPRSMSILSTSSRFYF
ncbi:MAG: ABC transporter permease subunit [Spartobacteria bacterium]